MIFIKKSIDLRRVVVTGMGIISPAGLNLPENWKNISSGKSCITRITRFDVTDFYSQIAGELKGFEPLNYFDRKELRTYDKFIQYALVASDEAILDSQIKMDKVNLERFGVYIGSGIGGIETIEKNTWPF